MGAPIDVLEQHDAHGRVLLRVDVARAARRYGKPHICLPRRRLLERLADGLPPGTLSFDRSCTGISYDDGQVRASFAEGGTETADLLVGGDGHHSVVRRDLWGGDPTKPTGWATWQGLTRVPIEITSSRRGVMVIGRAGLCGLMPAGEDLLQWWFDVCWSPDATRTPTRPSPSCAAASEAGRRGRSATCWRPSRIATSNCSPITVIPYRGLGCRPIHPRR